MKILAVGDPHIRPEDLEEGRRLIDRVVEVAKASTPDAIVFMGDLFHTHSILHVEVMHFWRDAMARLIGAPVYLLLGNHDAPHDMKPGVHALAALRVDEHVIVLDHPQARLFADGTTIGFVPFMRSNEDFVRACKGWNVDTIYCHQEFDGCRYDNGFYAKHGVNPEDIPQKLVISGHIHAGQEFGKVWYLGAPRWMTASDANQDRFIWLIEHAQDGSVASKTPFPTDPHCQRIIRLEDAPEAPASPEAVPAGARVLVDIRGPAAWLQERKALWQGKARIRTFLVGEKRVQVRESDGVPVAFRRYLSGYQPRFGTGVDRLERMTKERLGF